MSDDSFAPISTRKHRTIEDAYEELDSIVARLANTRTHQKKVVARRRDLLLFLLSKGEQQAALSKRCGVSAMAIAEAVGSRGTGTPRRR